MGFSSVLIIVVFRDSTISFYYYFIETKISSVCARFTVTNDLIITLFIYLLSKRFYIQGYMSVLIRSCDNTRV